MAEEKKTQKSAEKKPGFFKSVKTEAKKVTWYPKKTTLMNTIWVIIAMLILGGLIFLVDIGFQELLGLFA